MSLKHKTTDIETQFYVLIILLFLCFVDCQHFFGQFRWEWSVFNWSLITKWTAYPHIILPVDIVKQLTVLSDFYQIVFYWIWRLSYQHHSPWFLYCISIRQIRFYSPATLTYVKLLSITFILFYGWTVNSVHYCTKLYVSYIVWQYSLIPVHFIHDTPILLLIKACPRFAGYTLIFLLHTCLDFFIFVISHLLSFFIFQMIGKWWSLYVLSLTQSTDKTFVWNSNNNIYFRDMIRAACFQISFPFSVLIFLAKSVQFFSPLYLSSTWNEPVQL